MLAVVSVGIRWPRRALDRNLMLFMFSIKIYSVFKGLTGVFVSCRVLLVLWVCRALMDPWASRVLRGLQERKAREEMRGQQELQA